MSKVKWDHNPKNNYNDGYNAARRYGKKHTSLGMVLYCTGAGLLSGLLLAYIF